MTDAPEPAEADALTTRHVRQAVAGDTDSLTWVVERFTPLLMMQAAYHLDSKTCPSYEPEDLVNDTWAIALPRLEEMPPRGGRYTPTLVKFLSTTLLYLVKNLVKKQIRRESAGERPLPDGPPDGESPLERLVAEDSGVVTRIVRQEMKGTVLSHLDTLVERDREVIVLRGIEQHSNQTVAMLLGLEPEAVRLRYHRALKRLRAQLPASVFDEFVTD